MCICVCMYVCVYIYMYTYIHVLHTIIYTLLYKCIYVYIYICIHTYIHIYKGCRSRPSAGWRDPHRSGVQGRGVEDAVFDNNRNCVNTNSTVQVYAKLSIALLDLKVASITIKCHILKRRIPELRNRVCSCC